MVQESSALKGKTIAITRPSGQAEEVAKMIEKRGGKPYLIPAIEIKAPSDLKPIKKIHRRTPEGRSGLRDFYER